MADESIQSSETSEERVAYRIFLSYGHRPREHVALAERIRDDLIGRGHKVWFDGSKLKAKHDWEKEIELEIEGCSKFIILMSPYSIRRSRTTEPTLSDGYCLNEIAKAVERKKEIIPIWLEWTEQGPPLSICRLQWIEMQPCVPIDKNESFYLRKALPALVDAVENGHIPLEGEWSYIKSNLIQFDFQSEMDRHIARFIGRDWLFSPGGPIEQWLNSQSGSSVFWLVGPPGIGKSAIATQLAHRKAEAVAIHYCQASNHALKDSRKAFLSIAHQLATQIPKYMELVSKMDLEAEVKGSARAIFERLIAKPLAEIFEGYHEELPPYIVIIDGLDEAAEGDRNELAEVIAERWAILPPNIRLFLTSRDHRSVTEPFVSLDPFFVDADMPENREDIRNFIKKSLIGIGATYDLEPLIKNLTGKSEGVFLYAALIVSEIETGKRQLNDLTKFPLGLNGYYRSYFTREFPDIEDYRDRIRPILNILISSKEPIPLLVLGLSLELSEHELRKRLADLGTMFVITKAGIKPFHKSIRDWLTTVSERTGRFNAGRYAIDVENGHERIANACLRLWKERLFFSCGYKPKYLPSHLAATGRNEDLEELVRDVCDNAKQVYDEAALAGRERSETDEFFRSLNREIYAIGMRERELPLLEAWHCWSAEAPHFSAALLIAKSRYFRRLGEPGKARQFAKAAAAEATSEHQALEALLEAELDVYWGDPAEIYVGTQRFADENQAALAKEDTLRAKLLHTRYFSCHDLDRNQEAYDLAIECANLYQGLGDQYKELISLVNAADALWGLGDSLAALETLEDILGRARRRGVLQVINMAMLCKANILATLGRSIEAQQNYEKGLSISRKISGVNDYDYLYGELYRTLFLGLKGLETGEKILDIGDRAMKSKHRYIYVLSRGYACVFGKFFYDSFTSMWTELSMSPGAVLHGAAGWAVHRSSIPAEYQGAITELAFQVEGLKGFPDWVSRALGIEEYIYS